MGDDTPCYLAALQALGAIQDQIPDVEHYDGLRALLALVKAGGPALRLSETHKAEIYRLTQEYQGIEYAAELLGYKRLGERESP